MPSRRSCPPEEILALPSMPPGNPSYPGGPYRFIDRDYMVVTYESDPDAIRRMVPEPLQPDGSNQVFYEWINMPDSSGFGSYEESGVVIPCLHDDEPEALGRAGMSIMLNGFGDGDEIEARARGWKEIAP